MSMSNNFNSAFQPKNKYQKKNQKGLNAWASLFGLIEKKLVCRNVNLI